MKVSWTKPSECLTFWDWLYAYWNLRAGWDGPCVMLREHGHRIFGFEFVRIVRHTSD